MSNKKIKNVAHSISAHLKKFASKKKLAFEFVLLRYAMERFLYRLGKSSHTDRFVLKGASAFAVWVGPTFRATRDADLHCHGNSAPELLKQCFVEICKTKVVDDGLAFDLTSIRDSEIKKGEKYKRTRVTLNAKINQARIRLQFDISFGDSVYPKAQLHDYPTLLGQDCPRIRVYPFYTVTAEKFEAMVSLGMSNSRVKDFFDLWLLSEIFDFDGTLLHETLSRTFARRNTAFPVSLPLALTAEFHSDAIKCSLWNTFIRKTVPERHPASLGEAAERIAELVMPLILDSKYKMMIWDKTQGWQ